MIRKIILSLFLMIFAMQTQAQCWKDISPGDYFTVGLKIDGSYWAWGNNSAGEYGDGTYAVKYIPTMIGSEKDWKSISAGSYHVVALKNDGSLWTWGNNRQGQLGIGSTEEQINIPNRVGIDNDWKSISAGGSYVMAIKNDGSLWGWGNNTSYELGDGTNISKNIPTQIGVANDWKNIYSAIYLTTAIKNDGSIWRWGNSGGQNIKIPTKFGLDLNWKDISAFGYHFLALKNDNSLWAWGDNVYGQIGDGTISNFRNTPIQIVSEQWNSITSGLEHSIAIKDDGSLWSWGRNHLYQLGDGTIIDKSIPTRINATSVDWQYVFAGQAHGLALKTNGSLWAWGYNLSAQLGDGTVTSRNIPVQITQPCRALSVSDTNLLPLQIYPNPAKDYFSINKKDIKQVQLYSLDGKLLKEYSASEKYSVHGLVKGIYIIKITDSKEVSSSYKLQINN